MKQLFLLKIGGKVIEDQGLLEEALQVFANQPGYKILIHGGGKRATEVSKQLGIPVQMVNGRRITNAATLEVAVMVYAGLANKTIVANAILAHKRPVKDVDYGFAGDVDVVNATTIQTLLEGNLTPVFCAITHDGNGQLLNTNADTKAMQLATALAPYYAVSLNFCFEKRGVLLNPSDDHSVIPTLNRSEYQQYQADGVITHGMLPKLDNAFEALEKGVKEVRIGDVSGVFEKKGTLLKRF